MATEYDEKAIVERAKTDPEAFGLLYETYVDKIYNYIYFHTGNYQDAEDLTARTFHRALNKIDTYVDRGLPFSAWLYRIAHNIVANWHRDSSRRKTVSIDDVALVSGPADSPQHQAERREEQALLIAAIHRLPHQRQQLLFLKFSEGMSNADIGRVMGRSEGAIKSLYHRTLLALREILAEYADIAGALPRPDEQADDAQRQGT